MELSLMKKKGSGAPFLVLAGCILGVLIFGAVYGFAVVNPTYDAWIFDRNGDVTQHYLGWLFFRRSPWHFPFGLTDGLTSDGAVSCMYTDSLPILAIFFKIFSPILPESFQYIGIWELLSFALMGGFSALLLRKFSKNPIFCLSGSVFYILAPTVLQRAFGHDALSGQWLIVLAILLWAYQDHKWKSFATPVILWTITGMLAVSIHSYFIPMIYMIMLGYAITDLLNNKEILRPVFIFLSTTVFSLLFMYCLGAFYGNGEYEAGGLGAYSANLNALFSSQRVSKFLKPLNYIKGQSEGFGYLGLGIILAGFLALFLIVYHLEQKQTPFFKRLGTVVSANRWSLLAFCVVIFVSIFFAASPVVTLNARVLYTIPYPDIIIRILSIFRASGRFIWVTDYLVFTAVLAVLSRIEKKKTMIFAVLLCLCIQLLDLRDWIRGKHDLFFNPVSYESPLKDAQWETLAEGANEIIFLPLPDNYVTHKEMYFSFAEFAYHHDMNLSSFYVVRVKSTSLKEYADVQLEQLAAGSGRTDAIYVFIDPSAVPATVDDNAIHVLDGYTVVKITD